MHLRLLEFRIKSQYAADVHWITNQSLIPELRSDPSCTLVYLIRHSTMDDNYALLTLWNFPANAMPSDIERCEWMRQQIEPFLADSSEWRMELSKNLQLEQVPVTEEPVVQSYAVATGGSASTGGLPTQGVLYLRLVSATIHPGKTGELNRIYQQEILPALQNTQGCLYAVLINDVESSNRSVSLTIWDSRESVEAYEQSGQFHALLEKVQHTFSDLYLWKLGLDRNLRESIKTSEDLTVETYDVIAATRQ